MRGGVTVLAAAAAWGLPPGAAMPHAMQLERRRSML